MHCRSGFFSFALGVALATCIAAAEAAPPQSGCTGGCGTVFAFDLKTAREKLLYSFDRKQGFAPVSGLARVGNTLYGTTASGGAGHAGTVFSIDRLTGVETLVHNFEGGLDGFDPEAALINDGALLYGTTLFGGGAGCGGFGCGTVYAIDPQTGASSVLYAFQQNETDGLIPEARLVDVGGLLFGTTVNGGAASCSCGTVFSLDPGTGAETVVHAFASGGDGANPYAGLIDVDGILYGTAKSGGHNYNGGIVFSVDSATGFESVVYQFVRPLGDGYFPRTGLTELGGLLYGTTPLGGNSDLGTVYSFDPGTGSETLLHSFQNSDGNNPGELIDVGGTLYGTTAYGGAHGLGTLFSITTSGTLTTLYSFDRRHGAVPLGSLHNVHGKLYGTTAEGGNPK
jgi:uncharacterized repeat protein (TIGR03803 family)